jgi:hypothetical protein
MHKLLSSGSDKKDYYYLYEKTTCDALGQELNSFFEKRNYRLEEGTNTNGVYGTGNAFLRFLFGGFVKRNKFKIEIVATADRVRLSVREGMSGFSGGAIGRSRMTSELKKITEEIKTNL